MFYSLLLWSFFFLQFYVFNNYYTKIFCCFWFFYRSVLYSWILVVVVVIKKKLCRYSLTSFHVWNKTTIQFLVHLSCSLFLRTFCFWFLNMLLSSTYSVFFQFGCRTVETFYQHPAIIKKKMLFNHLVKKTSFNVYKCITKSTE